MTKRKAPEDKQKVGRKTVMTPEVVTKLEEALELKQIALYRQNLNIDLKYSKD